MWLKGINQSTILPLDTFTFTRLSAEAGFEGIEYRVPKLNEVAIKGRLSDLNALIKRCNIKVVSL